MNFITYPDEYAVCRLSAGAELPTFSSGDFWSVTLTRNELSIVCRRDEAPSSGRLEPGWYLFRVDGELDFSLVGILADITRILTENMISVFAVSTYDTDYLLVKDLEGAVRALKAAGHGVNSR